MENLLTDESLKFKIKHDFNIYYVLLYEYEIATYAAKTLQYVSAWAHEAIMNTQINKMVLNGKTIQKGNSRQ